MSNDNKKGSRNKILFISGFLPSANVPSGGQKLVYEILKQQSENNDIILFAFSNELERSYRSKDEFSMCCEATVFELSKLQRIKSAISEPSLPLITSARYAVAKNLIRKFVQQNPPESVWVEFIQAASLLTLIPPEIPTTLVVHDLFQQALQRRSKEAHGLKRILWSLEAERTRRWESAILQLPGKILTLNEKDKELIEVCSGRKDVEVRYPVPQEIYQSIVRTPEKIKPDTILFWGLMSRAENEDAVIWFTEKVFPKILQQRPVARFLIAGANPSQKVMKLSGPRVDVLGFVDNPLDLFSSAAMAIAPLRLGAGIKIKVVEYLAAAIPTVATSVGAEGIRPDHNLIVANESEEFANACINLLRKQF